jgi:hypothetical protein
LLSLSEKRFLQLNEFFGKGKKTLSFEIIYFAVYPIGKLKAKNIQIE